MGSLLKLDTFSLKFFAEWHQVIHNESSVAKTAWVTVSVVVLEVRIGLSAVVVSQLKHSAINLIQVRERLV